MSKHNYWRTHISSIDIKFMKVFGDKPVFDSAIADRKDPVQSQRRYPPVCCRQTESPSDALTAAMTAGDGLHRAQRMKNQKDNLNSSLATLTMVTFHKWGHLVHHVFRTNPDLRQLQRKLLFAHQFHN